MTEIIVLVLGLLMKIVPIFIKEHNKREQYKKKIQDSIDKIERRANEITHIREQQKEIDRILSKKWQKKWGKKE